MIASAQEKKGAQSRQRRAFLRPPPPPPRGPCRGVHTQQAVRVVPREDNSAVARHILQAADGDLGEEDVDDHAEEEAEHGVADKGGRLGHV